MRETGEPRTPGGGAEVEVGRGPRRAVPPSPGGISLPHQLGQTVPPPSFVHSRPLSAQPKLPLSPPASSPEPDTMSASDLGAHSRLHPGTLEGTEELRFSTLESAWGALPGLPERRG